MGFKKCIKLGRSNYSDIIIKDISVSRNHAFITLYNKSKILILRIFSLRHKI